MNNQCTRKQGCVCPDCAWAAGAFKSNIPAVVKSPEGAPSISRNTDDSSRAIHGDVGTLSGHSESTERVGTNPPVRRRSAISRSSSRNKSHSVASRASSVEKNAVIDEFKQNSMAVGNSEFLDDAKLQSEGKISTKGTAIIDDSEKRLSSIGPSSLTNEDVVLHDSELMPPPPNSGPSIFETALPSATDDAAKAQDALAAAQATLLLRNMPISQRIASKVNAHRLSAIQELLEVVNMSSEQKQMHQDALSHLNASTLLQFANDSNPVCYEQSIHLLHIVMQSQPQTLSGTASELLQRLARALQSSKPTQVQQTMEILLKALNADGITSSSATTLLAGLRSLAKPKLLKATAALVVGVGAARLLPHTTDKSPQELIDRLPTMLLAADKSTAAAGLQLSQHLASVFPAETRAFLLKFVEKKNGIPQETFDKIFDGISDKSQEVQNQDNEAIIRNQMDSDRLSELDSLYASEEAQWLQNERLFVSSSMHVPDLSRQLVQLKFDKVFSPSASSSSNSAPSRSGSAAAGSAGGASTSSGAWKEKVALLDNAISLFSEFRRIRMDQRAASEVVTAVKYGLRDSNAAVVSKSALFLAEVASKFPKYSLSSTASELTSTVSSTSSGSNSSTGQAGNQLSVLDAPELQLQLQLQQNSTFSPLVRNVLSPLVQRLREKNRACSTAAALALRALLRFQHLSLEDFLMECGFGSGGPGATANGLSATISPGNEATEAWTKTSTDGKARIMRFLASIVLAAPTRISVTRIPPDSTDFEPRETAEVVYVPIQDAALVDEAPKNLKGFLLRAISIGLRDSHVDVRVESERACALLNLRLALRAQPFARMQKREIQDRVNSLKRATHSVGVPLDPDMELILQGLQASKDRVTAGDVLSYFDSSNASTNTGGNLGSTITSGVSLTNTAVVSNTVHLSNTASLSNNAVASSVNIPAASGSVSRSSSRARSQEDPAPESNARSRANSSVPVAPVAPSASSNVRIPQRASVSASKQADLVDLDAILDISVKTGLFSSSIHMFDEVSFSVVGGSKATATLHPAPSHLEFTVPLEGSPALRLRLSLPTGERRASAEALQDYAMYTLLPVLQLIIHKLPSPSPAARASPPGESFEGEEDAPVAVNPNLPTLRTICTDFAGFLSQLGSKQFAVRAAAIQLLGQLPFVVFGSIDSVRLGEVDSLRAFRALRQFSLQLLQFSLATHGVPATPAVVAAATLTLRRLVLGEGIANYSISSLSSSDWNKDAVTISPFTFSGVEVASVLYSLLSLSKERRAHADFGPIVIGLSARHHPYPVIVKLITLIYPSPASLPPSPAGTSGAVKLEKLPWSLLHPNFVPSATTPAAMSLVLGSFAALVTTFGVPRVNPGLLVSVLTLERLLEAKDTASLATYTCGWATWKDSSIKPMEPSQMSEFSTLTTSAAVPLRSFALDLALVLHRHMGPLFRPLLSSTGLGSSSSLALALGSRCGAATVEALLHKHSALLASNTSPASNAKAGAKDTSPRDTFIALVLKELPASGVLAFDPRIALQRFHEAPVPLLEAHTAAFQPPGVPVSTLNKQSESDGGFQISDEDLFTGLDAAVLDEWVDFAPLVPRPTIELIRAADLDAASNTQNNNKKDELKPFQKRQNGLDAAAEALRALLATPRRPLLFINQAAVVQQPDQPVSGLGAFVAPFSELTTSALACLNDSQANNRPRALLLLALLLRTLSRSLGCSIFASTLLFNGGNTSPIGSSASSAISALVRGCMKHLAPILAESKKKSHSLAAQLFLTALSRSFAVTTLSVSLKSNEKEKDEWEAMLDDGSPSAVGAAKTVELLAAVLAGPAQQGQVPHSLSTSSILSVYGVGGGNSSSSILSHTFNPSLAPAPHNALQAAEALPSAQREALLLQLLAALRVVASSPFLLTPIPSHLFSIEGMDTESLKYQLADLPDASQLQGLYVHLVHALPIFVSLQADRAGGVRAAGVDATLFTLAILRLLLARNHAIAALVGLSPEELSGFRDGAADTLVLDNLASKLNTRTIDTQTLSVVESALACLPATAQLRPAKEAALGPQWSLACSIPLLQPTFQISASHLSANTGISGAVGSRPTSRAPSRAQSRAQSRAPSRTASRRGSEVDISNPQAAVPSGNRTTNKCGNNELAATDGLLAAAAQALQRPRRPSIDDRNKQATLKNANTSTTTGAKAISTNDSGYGLFVGVASQYDSRNSKNALDSMNSVFSSLFRGSAPPNSTESLKLFASMAAHLRAELQQSKSMTTKLVDDICGTPYNFQASSSSSLSAALNEYSDGLGRALQFLQEQALQCHAQICSLFESSAGMSKYMVQKLLLERLLGANEFQQFCEINLDLLLRTVALALCEPLKKPHVLICAVNLLETLVRLALLLPDFFNCHNTRRATQQSLTHKQSYSTFSNVDSGPQSSDSAASQSVGTLLCGLRWVEAELLFPRLLERIPLLLLCYSSSSSFSQTSTLSATLMTTQPLSMTQAPVVSGQQFVFHLVSLLLLLFSNDESLKVSPTDQAPPLLRLLEQQVLRVLFDPQQRPGSRVAAANIVLAALRLPALVNLDAGSSTLPPLSGPDSVAQSSYSYDYNVDDLTLQYRPARIESSTSPSLFCSLQSNRGYSSSNPGSAPSSASLSPPESPFIHLHRSILSPDAVGKLIRYAFRDGIGPAHSPPQQQELKHAIIDVLAEVFVSRLNSDLARLLRLSSFTAAQLRSLPSGTTPDLPAQDRSALQRLIGAAVVQREHALSTSALPFVRVKFVVAAEALLRRPDPETFVHSMRQMDIMGDPVAHPVGKPIEIKSATSVVEALPSGVRERLYASNAKPPQVEVSILETVPLVNPAFTEIAHGLLQLLRPLSEQPPTAHANLPVLQGLVSACRQIIGILSTSNTVSAASYDTLRPRLAASAALALEHSLQSLPVLLRSLRERVIAHAKAHPMPVEAKCSFDSLKDKGEQSLFLPAHLLSYFPLVFALLWRTVPLIPSHQACYAGQSGGNLNSSSIQCIATSLPWSFVPPSYLSHLEETLAALCSVSTRTLRDILGAAGHIPLFVGEKLTTTMNSTNSTNINGNSVDLLLSAIEGAHAHLCKLHKKSVGEGVSLVLMTAFSSAPVSAAANWALRLVSHAAEFTLDSRYVLNPSWNTYALNTVKNKLAVSGSVAFGHTLTLVTAPGDAVFSVPANTEVQVQSPQAQGTHLESVPFCSGSHLCYTPRGSYSYVEPVEPLLLQSSRRMRNVVLLLSRVPSDAFRHPQTIFSVTGSAPSTVVNNPWNDMVALGQRQDRRSRDDWLADSEALEQDAYLAQLCSTVFRQFRSERMLLKMKSISSAQRNPTGTEAVHSTGAFGSATLVLSSGQPPNRLVPAECVLGQNRRIMPTDACLESVSAGVRETLALLASAFALAPTTFFHGLARAARESCTSFASQNYFSSALTDIPKGNGSDFNCLSFFLCCALASARSMGREPRSLPALLNTSYVSSDSKGEFVIFSALETSHSAAALRSPVSQQCGFMLQCVLEHLRLDADLSLLMDAACLNHWRVDGSGSMNNIDSISADSVVNRTIDNSLNSELFVEARGDDSMLCDPDITISSPVTSSPTYNRTRSMQAILGAGPNSPLSPSLNSYNKRSARASPIQELRKRPSNPARAGEDFTKSPVMNVAGEYSPSNNGVFSADTPLPTSKYQQQLEVTTVLRPAVQLHDTSTPANLSQAAVASVTRLSGLHTLSSSAKMSPKKGPVSARSANSSQVTPNIPSSSASRAPVSTGSGGFQPPVVAVATGGPITELSLPSFASIRATAAQVNSLVSAALIEAFSPCFKPSIPSSNGMLNVMMGVDIGAGAKNSPFSSQPAVWKEAARVIAAVVADFHVQYENILVRNEVLRRRDAANDLSNNNPFSALSGADLAIISDKTDLFDGLPYISPAHSPVLSMGQLLNSADKGSIPHPFIFSASNVSTPVDTTKLLSLVQNILSSDPLSAAVFLAVSHAHAVKSACAKVFWTNLRNSLISSRSTFQRLRLSALSAPFASAADGSSGVLVDFVPLVYLSHFFSSFNGIFVGQNHDAPSDTAVAGPGAVRSALITAGVGTGNRVNSGIAPSPGVNVNMNNAKPVVSKLDFGGTNLPKESVSISQRSSQMPPIPPTTSYTLYHSTASQNTNQSNGAITPGVSNVDQPRSRSNSISSVGSTASLSSTTKSVGIGPSILSRSRANSSSNIGSTPSIKAGIPVTTSDSSISDNMVPSTLNATLNASGILGTSKKLVIPPSIAAVATPRRPSQPSTVVYTDDDI